MIKRFLKAVEPLRAGFNRCQSEQLGPFCTFTNYRRIWMKGFLLLGAVSLLPLVVVVLIHYRLLGTSIDSEFNLRMERLTSDARIKITSEIEKRLDIFSFTVKENTYEQLTAPGGLAGILKNLKLGFDGFEDLRVITPAGVQTAYAGPHEVKKTDYSNQDWFKESKKHDVYISALQKDGDAAYMMITAKSFRPGGSFFILGAVLQPEFLTQTLSAYKTDEYTDIFLVNRSGIIQTTSAFYGDIFVKLALALPDNAPGTQTFLDKDDQMGPIIAGSAVISALDAETAFILVAVKQKKAIMSIWKRLQTRLNYFAAFCALGIIVAISVACTFVINTLYRADEHKAETTAMMEQNNRLASIGQLAAGVAHEINNPMALIDQTAGYIKDLLALREQPHKGDKELVENIDLIIDEVERCGGITNQLLGFSRKFDIQIQKINIKEIVSDVLIFHQKEAQYRNIKLTVDVAEDIPEIVTDRGKLQQILMNLVNNAFQAMENGNCLDIRAFNEELNKISITVRDNGCGIAQESLTKIFEPFYTTKEEGMGTGLGLSITYGLVEKLGGGISVVSKENEGTVFTVTLPVNGLKERVNSYENSAG